MASVFLSYVREDADQARAIAAALERAGHSVWWDRRIKGGAQFSAEIEAALTAADKVVVLWSALSVKSAWVRDEAAFGRDRGNLIPLTIDGTPPPLGFRQFQTIDLTHDARDDRAPDLQRLLEALGADADVGMDSVAAAAQASRKRSTRPQTSLLVAAAVMLAALAAGGYWWRSEAALHPPIVAVEGVNDRSQEPARSLAVRLADLQSTRTDTFQLVADSEGADLILQVDARDGAAESVRDLALLSGRNHSVLWSASLKQPPAKADDLAQQVTLTSERVLSCALEALADRRDRIDPVTLKLYLGGCSRLEDVYGLGRYDPTLVKLFGRVIAKAPHFGGAWAKLLTAETEVARNPDPPPTLIADVRQHIAQAQKLGLKIGEIYAAKAALLPSSDFLGTFALYDQGIRADPDNPYLYRLRSERWQAVGQMSQSISDAGRALELDPLSPALMDNYISALAYGGKTEAAYEQLRKAEAMWPAASNLEYARYRLDLRYGDPNEALATHRGTTVGAGDPSMEAFIQARIHPSPSNIQRAIDEERVQYTQEPRYISGLIQVLGQFGRKDEAIDVLLNYKRLDALGYNAEVLFRPALHDMWQDPRAIAAAARVGLLDYWRKSGNWPDFCAAPELPYDCRKEAAKYPASR